MIGSIVRRITWAGLAIIVMTLVVFSAVRLTGDPVDLLVQESVSAGDRERFTKALGLDQPLPVQYVSFLERAIHGDFGRSYIDQRPVIAVVLERLPATLALGALALALGVLTGVPLGVLAAVRQDSIWDHVARTLAGLGQSIPTFVLGMALMWLFAVGLGWLPAAGMSGAASFVLPSSALGVHIAAGFVRLTRSAMLDVLGADYIQLARSVGQSEATVVWRHAFGNAIGPVLTYFGVIAAQLLTGTIVVENLFAWPGVGRLLVSAVSSRDFQITQAIVLILTSILIALNLLIDSLHAVLDPRVRVP